MAESSMISSLVWIPHGYAKKQPQEYDLTQQEIDEMKQDDEIMNKLREQDEQMMNEEDNDMPIFASEINYLKDQQNEDEYPFGFDQIDEEDKEDYTIKKSDAMIVAAKIEGEFSTLEVYLYEESKCNLFMHHEIQLSAFPLSLEWLKINPLNFEQESYKKGNFLIVGTFLPEIEIWNLDILNTIEPALILGGAEKKSQIKKSKKLKNKEVLSDQSHQDAVICLSLNQFRQQLLISFKYYVRNIFKYQLIMFKYIFFYVRFFNNLLIISNILASGSADTQVKLWDITQKQCLHTFNHHQDKVQCLKWNPQEESILLTGSFDKTLNILDVRQQQNAMKTTIQSDIECAIWDPMNPVNIVYSCEDGTICQLDARKFNLDYVFKTQAHFKTATSVSMSAQVPGLLASTSLDGNVKIWDTQQIVNKQPKLVYQKDCKAGKLFCGSFYEDSPWTIACGSSKGELVIWDTSISQEIVNVFGSRVTDPRFQPNSNDGDEVELIAQNKRESDDDDDNQMEQEN